MYAATATLTEMKLESPFAHASSVRRARMDDLPDELHIFRLRKPIVDGNPARTNDAVGGGQ